MTIPIFRPGPHYPALDAQALEASAQAYDPALHEAPIVIGHPKTDLPAHGWVKALSFSEGLLQAEPHQVEPVFAEAVSKGRWKKVSASFYRPDAQCNPKRGVYYLRHVGFLGAQPPDVKGLPPVSFAEGETASDYVAVEFADASPWIFNVLARLFRRQRDHLIEQTDLETADKVLPEWDLEELSREAERQLQEHVQSPASFSENDPPAQPGAQEPPMDHPDAAARQAELETRETKLKEREQALAQNETTRAQKDAQNFAEQLVSQGRVLPRDEAPLAALLTTLPEDATVNFAEGDSEVVKPGPAATFFRQFLSSLPVQVDFSERSAPTGEEAAGEPKATIRVPAGYHVAQDQAALHQRILNFAEKNNVTYDEAVTAVSRLEG